ncbi:MAG: hypothetical protein ACO4B5_11450 [Steroidobacteraceae bacterium]
MTAPVLIGLASPQPGCGKTAVACSLVGDTGVLMPFAGPLKEAGCDILFHFGVPGAEARRLLYIDKHEVIPQLGVTGRHFLQTLGTDWGRNLINKSIWVDAWRRRYESATAEDGVSVVVVDDVRFPAEAQLIKDLGGQLWWISRPVLEPTEAVHHESEGQLVDSPLIDRVIANSGTLEQLHEVTLDALRFLQQVVAKRG